MLIIIIINYRTNLLLQDNEKDKQRLKEAERKAKEIEKGSQDSLQVCIMIDVCSITIYIVLLL